MPGYVIEHNYQTLLRDQAEPSQFLCKVRKSKTFGLSKTVISTTFPELAVSPRSEGECMFGHVRTPGVKSQISTKPTKIYTMNL